MKEIIDKKQARRIYIQNKINQGICVNCTSTEVVQGKQKCQVCLDKAKLYRQKRIEKGICYVCGHGTLMEGKKRCQKCFDRETKVRKKKYEEGFCVSCKRELKEANSSACTKCNLIRTTNWNNLKLGNTCKKCQGIKSRTDIVFCDMCYEISKQEKRDQSYKLKIDTLNAYGGPECACCKEPMISFLTLDHIQGDGAKHRKEIAKMGNSMYRWLRNNNYPAGFQVLCYNCNCGKRQSSCCPHKLKQTVISDYIPFTFIA